MTGFTCHHCGEASPVFAPSGMTKLQGLGLPILAQLPIDDRLCAGGDSGKPLVLSQPDHPISRAFSALATDLTNKYP